MTRLLLATALLSVTVLEACGLNCENAACIAGADIALTVSTPLPSLEGGSLRVCRNDLCSDGSISSSRTIQFSANDLAITHVILDVGMLLVEVPPTEGIALKNGDVYTLELRDNAGTVVANKRWEATYTKRYPNGEDCGGSCSNTHLE